MPSAIFIVICFVDINFIKMNISLIQSDIFWADIQSNLRKTEKDLASLSGKTDLAVLPEMFSTGFCTDQLDLADSKALTDTFRSMVDN